MEKQKVKDAGHGIMLMRKKAISLMKRGNISAYIRTLIALEQIDNGVLTQIVCD